MPKETGQVRESRKAQGDIPHHKDCKNSANSSKTVKPFTLCFTIAYRTLTIPKYPEAGYPTGNVPTQLRCEILNLFTELLKSHPDRPDGAIQVAIVWQPPASGRPFDLAEVRNLCELTTEIFRKEPETGAVSADARLGVSISMTPSVELTTLRLRAMLAEFLGGDLPKVFIPETEEEYHRIAEIITHFLRFVRHLPPDWQCQVVGAGLAAEYDSATGEPAAFVTFSNFSSEIVDVGDVCRYLGRSRSAVTTYVQEGLLPAIRLGEKQYLFFRKHVETFSPPKKGPKAKTDRV